MENFLPAQPESHRAPWLLSHSWARGHFQCWVSEPGSVTLTALQCMGEAGSLGREGKGNGAQHPWGADAAGRAGDGGQEQRVMFKTHSYLIKEMLTPLPQHCKYCCSRTASAQHCAGCRWEAARPTAPMLGCALWFGEQSWETTAPGGIAELSVGEMTSSRVTTMPACFSAFRNPLSAVEELTVQHKRLVFSPYTRAEAPQQTGFPSLSFPWHQHPQGFLLAQQRSRCAEVSLKPFSHSGCPCGPLACRTSIIAKIRDGLWKPKCSPGCFPEVCAIHHQKEKKKGMKLSMKLSSATAEPQYNPLNTDTSQSCITEPLRETPLSDKHCEQISARQNWVIGISLESPCRLWMPKHFLAVLLNVSAFRHIWKD